MRKPSMVAILVVLILILAILFARTRPRTRHLKLNSYSRVAQALHA